MNKLWRNLAALLLAAALTLISPLLLWAARQDIIILHTNDIHCGVNDNIGLAGVAQMKKEAQAQTPYVVLVDAGDAVQGAPIGKLSQGEAIVNIMNAVGYVFCVPGNHEFDYGMERFLELAGKQQAGYYSANFLASKTGKPVLKPYKLLDFDGTKIAFIGATTPATLTSSTPLYFQNTQGQYIYNFCEDVTGKKLYAQLQKYVDEARQEGAQYVFLVAHLGLNGVPPQWSSERVAQNTTGITAIIDGHSHESYVRVVQNKRGHDVLLAQAGTKLNRVGEIRLTAAGTLSAKLHTLAPGKDEAAAKIISQEMEAYAPLLTQPVGEALVQLYSNDPQTGARLVRRQESNLADFAADALKTVLDCDVALVNGGGVRGELKQGLLSYQDILEAFPFDNRCVILEITGQQLLDCLELGVTRYPEESGGFMQVSGLTYTVDSQIPSSVMLDEKGNFVGVAGRYRVSDVVIGGKPLALRSKYTVGGTAYVLQNGGDGMTMFKNAKVVQDNGVSDTNVILEYLQNHLSAVIGEQYADPYGDGRIRIK